MVQEVRKEMPVEKVPCGWGRTSILFLTAIYHRFIAFLRQHFKLLMVWGVARKRGVFLALLVPVFFLFGGPKKANALFFGGVFLAFLVSHQAEPAATAETSKGFVR